MATPLRLLRCMNKAAGLLVNSKSRKLAYLHYAKRHLLSPAYGCSEVWSKYLKDSSLSELTLSELAVQVHEQLDKTEKASRVDMNVLVHKFDTLDGDEEEAEFMEEILARYNRCQDSFPPNASISHAIVRCYVQAGLADRLLHLLTDRLTFGILPNVYTLNLLLDTFIKKENYAAASKIAYLSTMQEDFSNPINALLSLECVTQYLSRSHVDDLAPPPKEASDGEEVWIKVKYIHYPFYDDHFDIKDERFLLGKTMMALARLESLGLPSQIGTSLKLIGAGLYHKFSEGLSCLKHLIYSADQTVSQEALDYFSDSLDKVESRDADEPEVEIALRTIDDEIHRMLLTHHEKEEFQATLAQLKEKLVSQGKCIEDFQMQPAVHEFVMSNINKYESKDIDLQLTAFESWASLRDKDIDDQLYEFKKLSRIEEMKQQLQELQEKEELLNYFDMEEEIRLKFMEEDSESDPRLTITKLE